MRIEIELLSRREQKQYDNHGCSWGKECEAWFKVKTATFRATYNDTGYWVTIYQEFDDEKPHLDRNVADIEFGERPILYNDEEFVQELERLLRNNIEFQNRIRAEARRKLTEVATNVFEMSNDYD